MSEKWISIKDEGLPNFCIHGFQTGLKVRFKAGDGEHVGIYHGYGGFADENRRSLNELYDVGFEGDRQVTHWGPMKSQYYDLGNIETIGIIKAKLTAEQYQGFLLGNIIKYSCRLNSKGCPEQDAEKLLYYANALIDTVSPAK